jgi:WD40 repeat protein
MSRTRLAQHALVLTVFLACNSGTLRADEAPKWRLKAEGSQTPKAVAISADNKVLAQVDNELIRIWNLETGKLVRSWKNPEGTLVRTSASLSPDGKRLAVSGTTLYHGDILVFNTGDGELVWHKKDATNSSWLELTFSPDGKRVVSTGNFIDQKDKETLLKVWDAENGGLLHELKGGTKCRDLPIPFAPDGKTTVALSEFDRLIFWDITTGKASPEVRVVEAGWSNETNEAYANWIGEYAFAPDGKLLAIRSPKSLFLWDRETAKRVRELASPGEGTHLQFSADGSAVLGFTNRGLVSWDVKTGTAKTLLKIEYSSPVAFSPDRKLFVSGFDVYQIAK